MYRSTFTVNDNITLSYQSSLPTPLPIDSTTAGSPASSYPSTLIILLHGFSGSSNYFTRNFSDLSSSSAAWVVALDLRGHGASETPSDMSGRHIISRLAMDLHEFINHLQSIASTALTTETSNTQSRPPPPSHTPLHIIPIGCSLGAAILWTYVEIFSSSTFSGMIFVDQAPLQNRSKLGVSGKDQSEKGWDSRFAHKGCYDEATLGAAQRFWIETPGAAYTALVDECLGYRFAPAATDRISVEQQAEDEAFFVAESRKCNLVWLAMVMGDHTGYDHRESCEWIQCPVLVMAGRRSGCFTLDGCREVVYRVEKAHKDRGSEGLVRWSEFDSGHWLFFEEHERFNREVLEFVRECTKT